MYHDRESQRMGFISSMTSRALDKREYLLINKDNFCHFYIKTDIVTPHLNHLDKKVQMKGHNVRFKRKLRKIILQLSLNTPLIYSSGQVNTQIRMNNYTARFCVLVLKIPQNWKQETLTCMLTEFSIVRHMTFCPLGFTPVIIMCYILTRQI